MDISKASNFERFVFDLVGRDGSLVRELWAHVDRGGAFDLSQTPHWEAMQRFGFVSGSSTHADRLRTIREVFERHGQMIDTHTADGVKVALEKLEYWRGFDDREVPMLVLETAQPVKFEETIREALNREPSRPSELNGIEKLPQRVQVIDPSVEAVKAIIEKNC
jgi:threonine synthase